MIHIDRLYRHTNSHTMEYYTALKRKGILTPATMWSWALKNNSNSQFYILYFIYFTTIRKNCNYEKK